MMQLGKNIIDGSWYDILKAHIPGTIIGIFLAVFSAFSLFIGDIFQLSDPFILLILFISLPVIYLLSYIFFPTAWLGEIPDFLRNKCSSFLPPRFLSILNKRNRIGIKTIDH